MKRVKDLLDKLYQGEKVSQEEIDNLTPWEKANYDHDANIIAYNRAEEQYFLELLGEKK